MELLYKKIFECIFYANVEKNNENNVSFETKDDVLFYLKVTQIEIITEEFQIINLVIKSLGTYTDKHDSRLLIITAAISTLKKSFLQNRAGDIIFRVNKRQFYDFRFYVRYYKFNNKIKYKI